MDSFVKTYGRSFLYTFFLYLFSESLLNWLGCSRLLLNLNCDEKLTCRRSSFLGPMNKVNKVNKKFIIMLKGGQF